MLSSRKKMLNTHAAASTWSRPFTTGRPAFHRRPVVTSSLCERRNHHAASKLQQLPKHDLFTGWSFADRSRCHTLARAQAATDPLVPLGLDFLTFLAATVLVIPLFKSVKASPVLGFLFSGLLLGQLGYRTSPTCALASHHCCPSLPAASLTLLYV